MKNTGIVRKIDDLGRIVVPKEIRKSLNISTGEDIQFYVENDNIILKKYERIYSLKDKGNILVKELSKYTNSNIYLTDKHKVIICNDNSLVNFKLDNNITFYIEERKDFNDYGKLIDRSTYFYGLPIIIDADLMGSVIISNNNSISDIDILLVNILRNLLILNVY